MEITKNLAASVYLLAVKVECLPMPVPGTKLLTGERWRVDDSAAKLARPWECDE